MRILFPILIMWICLCVPLIGAGKKPLPKKESAEVIEKAIRALNEQYREKARTGNQEDRSKLRADFIKALRTLCKKHPYEIDALALLLQQAGYTVSPYSGALSDQAPHTLREHEELLREIAQAARKLIKENPMEIRAWRILLKAAQFSSNAKWKRLIFEETSILTNPKLNEVVNLAKFELKNLNTMGKPLHIKFEAADGRKVDLQKMKGKVVLVYFCASWCGPCRKEIPAIKATYEKLHKKGFEIIGISLDYKEKQFNAYTQKHVIPWPQYFDGKGFKSAIINENPIRWIPMMWLVDQRGHLVDRHARHDLEGKIQKLLTNPPPNK